MRLRFLALSILSLMVMPMSTEAQTQTPAPAQTQVQTQPLVSAEEWAIYKARFIDPSGRVIDNGNDNISHSEGQGYGLMLAYLAGNRADFELIWYFTETEFLVRSDGLSVWKWDPRAKPHVTDVNNATDGDILIAYALALAGAGWREPSYVSSAAQMAKAVHDTTVLRQRDRVYLLPGAAGFSAKDREDGPVVNSSYWVFEALPVLKLLAPSDDWDKIFTDGLDLLRQAQFGPAKLPPEWTSLEGRPAPAKGFVEEFSYNAVRIPLYLARAGVEDAALMRRIQQGMLGPDGQVSIIDLKTGRVKEVLDDRGYQIINHIVACVLDGTKLPADASVFDPTHYYPATLQLLGLAFVRENHPQCL